MEVNPYELFGLSYKIKIQDLKKAYYELALICHPDKGGNSQDMDIVHKAYQYLKKQLLNCDTNHNFEQLEKDFELFCQDQEEKPPCFAEIYDDLNEFVNTFNQTFLDNHKNNPFDKGYGELMEDKISKNNYIENDENDFCKPLNNDFKTDIIIYEEPFVLPNTYGEHYHLNDENITNFSHDTYNLHMTDYKMAFNNIPNLDEIITNTNTNRNLSDLIEERKKSIHYESYENKQSLITELQNKKIYYSIQIQKMSRGFITRILLKRKKYYKTFNYNHIQNIIVIQKIIRSFLAKQFVLNLIEHNHKQKQKNYLQLKQNNKRTNYNIVHF